MYIDVFKASFHWWGEIILILNSDGKIVILDDVETYLFDYVAKRLTVDEIIKRISLTEKIENFEVENFIDKFLKKYNDIFIKTDEKPEKICVSGEKGFYYPTEFHISLTNKCNLNCLHCYKNAGKQGDDIDSDALINFLKRFESKVPNITISGGEPLLHPNFSNLLSWINERYNVAVLTAGNVQDKNRFQSLGKVQRGVALSIYSSDPDVHDAFTCTKGSWKKTMDTLKQLIYKGIDVSVTTLLNSSNYDDIVKLIFLLRENNVENITIGRVMPVGRGKDSCTTEHSDEIYKKMLFLKEHYAVSLSEEHNIVDSAELFKPFNCVAGSLLWAIFENGDIYPCAVNKILGLKMGNIADCDFEILWNRSNYIKRICEIPCIQKTNSFERICPFEEV
jgi:MoaA/NifB/PqqE/SkfB family radical SAM enzyme